MLGHGDPRVLAAVAEAVKKMEVVGIGDTSSASPRMRSSTPCLTTSGCCAMHRPGSTTPSGRRLTARPRRVAAEDLTLLSERFCAAAADQSARQPGFRPIKRSNRSCRDADPRAAPGAAKNRCVVSVATGDSANPA